MPGNEHAICSVTKFPDGIQEIGDRNKEMKIETEIFQTLLCTYLVSTKVLGTGLVKSQFVEIVIIYEQPT